MSTLKTNEIKPSCAWFTVNQSCNLQCKWCYGQGTGSSPNKDMSIDMAMKLLTIVRSIGVRHITVIGGEPTLWTPLLEFNQKCVEEGIVSTLVTNAMRFGDDIFWDEYLSHRNHVVSVSIKANGPELLKNATGSLNCGQIRKGLCRAFEKFSIGASTVYNSICAEHILDIAQFAMDCGARRLSVSPCTPVFFGGKFHAEYVVEPSVMVRHLVDVYPRLNDITGGKLSIAMKLPFCFWPKDFISTLMDRGQITSSCQLRQRAGLVFDGVGNISVCNSLTSFPVGKYGIEYDDGASLLSYLKSEPVAKVYDKVTSFPSNKCIGCEKYDICGGGCMMFWTYFKPQDCIPGW